MPATESARSRFWTLPRGLMVASLALLVGVVVLWPPARDLVTRSARYLYARDMLGLRDYLRSFGAHAWLVSTGLMILQSLAAPVPAVAITFANALIYGPWWGALLSWSSAQLAAVLCMLIGKAFGRPFVERLFGASRVASFDRAFARHGVMAIVVARLMPIISFDLVSYAAGLTRMRVLAFFLATGVGQLPATIVYSHAGAELATSPSRSLQYLLWFLGPAVLLCALVWYRLRSHPAD